MTALVAQVLIEREAGLLFGAYFALVVIQAVGRDAEALSVDSALCTVDIGAVECNGLVALNSSTAVVQIA